MLAFWKSVGIGAFVGAAPPLAFTVLMALFSMKEVFTGHMSIWQLIYLAVLPLLVSFPIVLLSSIFIGLPLTLILVQLGRESIRSYVALGAAIGFVIPIAGLVLIDAPSGYCAALLGAIAGGTTGYVWWTQGREPRHHPVDGPPPLLGEEL